MRGEYGPQDARCTWRLRSADERHLTEEQILNHWCGERGEPGCFCRGPSSESPQSDRRPEWPRFDARCASASLPLAVVVIVFTPATHADLYGLSLGAD
jgi:hypothetical protein